MDLSTILGGGSFLGFLAFVVRDLIRAFANRGKVSADVGKARVESEVTLSKAAMEIVDRVTENYEARIRAVQVDAQAQIAGARADAANAVAASMHEVATARGEASQIRAEAAQMRNVVERIEQLLLRVRSTVWAGGPEPLDPRLARAREMLGDGTAPLSALVNGSR
jgi:hypothetical protein